MRALLLVLLLSLSAGVVAQEAAPTPAAVYTLARAAEETLVNTLPLEGGYRLTITGERLMRRTLLRFILTGPDGAPAPATTPLNLTLALTAYDMEEDAVREPVNVAAAPVYFEGAWWVGPLAFDAPGYLTGTVSVGDAAESARFEVDIYPNAPELPGWFIPVNLLVPFGVLALIVGILSRRRTALTAQPASAARARDAG